MSDEIIGQKITEVRAMTSTEAAREGWEFQGGQPPAVLVLENGLLLYPAQDQEGNGPGVLFGRTTDGETVAYYPDPKG